VLGTQPVNLPSLVSSVLALLVTAETVRLATTSTSVRREHLVTPMPHVPTHREAILVGVTGDGPVTVKLAHLVIIVP